MIKNNDELPTIEISSPDTPGGLHLVAKKPEPNGGSHPELRKLGVFTFRSLQKAAKSASQTPALVTGLLRSRSINFLVGDSGLGKTPLGVQLGICVASGIPFLDHPISNPGRVLYCDAESDQQSFVEFIASISQFLGLAEPPENFHVWSPNWETGHKTNQDDWATWSERLMGRVQAVAPTLVIVDPLRMFWPKVEGKSEEAAELIRALRQESKSRGCAWLLTHHRRKTNTQGPSYGLASDTHMWFEEAAGSRALINQADTRIGIVPHTGEADLLMGGFVRGTGPFVPMDLARVVVEEAAVGYKLLTGLALLKGEDLARFEQLGTPFRFKDAKNLMPGNSDSNTLNYIKRLQKLELVKKTGKKYVKTAQTNGADGVDGATEQERSMDSTHSMLEGQSAGPSSGSPEASGEALC